MEETVKFVPTFHMQTSFRESEQAIASLLEPTARSLQVTYVVDHLILQGATYSYPQRLESLNGFSKKRRRQVLKNIKTRTFRLDEVTNIRVSVVKA